MCFDDNAVRPAPPKLICVPLRKVSITVRPEYRQKPEIQRAHFYEQFKFFFNLYFLLVALSQFVPALKIGLWSCSCFSSRELFTTDITGFIATYIAPRDLLNLDAEIYGKVPPLPYSLPDIKTHAQPILP